MGLVSEDGAGDDHALDLARAFADGHEARVPVHALDFVFLAIAIAAMDLDSIAADALAHFGCKELGHAGGSGEMPARVLEPGRPIEHPACGINLGSRVRHH